MFVRNPWDRAVSLYHYHRGNPGSPYHAKAVSLDFTSWVKVGGKGSFRKQMADFAYDDTEKKSLILLADMRASTKISRCYAKNSKLTLFSPI